MSSIRTAWTPSNSKTDTFSLKSPLSKRAAPCGAALLLFSDKPRRTVRRTALLLYSSSIRIGITKKQAMVETAAPLRGEPLVRAVLGGGDHGDGNDRHGGLDDENASRKPGHIEKRAGQQDMPGARTKRKSSMRTAFRSSRRLRRPMS